MRNNQHNIKDRKEKNYINNNFAKENTLKKTLIHLNFEYFQNHYFLYKINNFLFSKKKKLNSNYSTSKNGNKLSYKIIELKKLKENKRFAIIKKINIIKEKIFVLFFMYPRQDYNLNDLNKRIIKCFISFYSKGEKFNSHIEESKIEFVILNIQFLITKD